MRTYSSDRVVVAWLGLPLDEGLAEGSFFTPRRTRKTWTQRQNGLGGAIRLFHPDRSGEVDFLINTESKVNSQLLALATTDRFTRVIQGPMVVTDLNTREVFIFTNAYITTEPDEQRATTSVEVTWTFAFTSIEHTPAVPTVNLVGT